jgi:putative addiction module CopG family antidote
MSDTPRLSPELQRFAEDQVRAGNFATVDQVTRAAFALLRQNAERRATVRQDLQERFDEMDAGHAVPTGDAEFADMVRERAAKYSAR